MVISLQTKPYTVSAEEGKVLQSMGALISLKATSEQTDGVFNLLDVTCPPGFATPLHIHYAEDVAIFVLDGALALFWGNERKEASAGSFFFQPRGTPHGFRAEGSVSARILYITIPAGLDGFVKEDELPTRNAEMERRAARYKIEIIGPLP